MLFKKLLYLLSKQDKVYLMGLFFLSIFVSLIEVIGVSILMPFLSVLNDFETIHMNEYYKMVYNFFSFKNEVEFITYFGIFIVFFYIFRSVINSINLYKMTKFVKERFYFIAYRLFENYLGLKYSDFTKRDSSELTKTIINETQHLTILINGLFGVISESSVLIFIYCFMLFINPQVTIFLTIFLFLIGFFLAKVISKKVKQKGVIREQQQRKFYDVINSSFGNFKFIKMKSNTDEIIDRFKSSSKEFVHTNIMTEVYSYTPKFFIEAIGFSMIVVVIIYLVNTTQANISQLIPLISFYVLGLLRILPSFNKIYTGYNYVQYYKKALDLIHNDMMFNIETLGNEKIKFDNLISLKNICFEYSEGKSVLKNISFKITKGQSVAFIGESGSGKSTLVDLICGIYRPKEGCILVDNVELNEKNIKNWRKNIGYIPQDPYLFNDTVGANVAFGSVYDEKKVIEALKKARIYEFLEKNLYGINTIVGEGGVMLSGGQKQRVAIARALYDDPELLILDEATSALNSEVEKEIMDEIYSVSKDKTLLIIAHRLSTLDKCQEIYKLQDGQIIEHRVQEKRL